MPQVYDFTENIMWVSVAGANVTDSGKVIGAWRARAAVHCHAASWVVPFFSRFPLPPVAGGPVAPAHARPWFRLDTAVLFAEKQ